MEKIRWGVVGAGGIADKRTIPGILEAEHAELTAVSARTKERAELLQKKHGAARAYDSAEALLDDPDVDAVYIATPVALHAEQIRLAADRGKAVFVEKPICSTLAEAEDAARYCEGKGVRAGAGFMMRFGTHAGQMRRIVAEGGLGQVVSGYAQFTLWSPYEPGNWRQHRSAAGGGALMDMGIHCIDLMRYITGMRVTQVTAMNEKISFPEPQYDVEDTSTVLMRMENGAQFVVQSNFNIPYAAAKWRLELFGTGGRLIGDTILSQEDGGTLNAITREELPPYPVFPEPGYGIGKNVPGEFGNLYTREIESFCRSLLDRTPLEVPLRDAIDSQRVVEAAYRSSREGHTVVLDGGER